VEELYQRFYGGESQTDLAEVAESPA